MKLIKLGKNVKTIIHTCKVCGSQLSYTEYDIKFHLGNWKRTGVESSKRENYKYIVCPVCNKENRLETWEEEY